MSLNKVNKPLRRAHLKSKLPKWPQYQIQLLTPTFTLLFKNL